MQKTARHDEFENHHPTPYVACSIYILYDQDHLPFQTQHHIRTTVRIDHKTSARNRGQIAM